MDILNLFWFIPLSIFISQIVNHLADTLPIYRAITPAPICLTCAETYGYFHYFSFKKCPNCAQSPAKRRIITTILFIITYVLVFLFPPAYSGLFLTLIIISFLSLIFIIDFEHRLILHPVSIAGAILFTVIGLYLNGWQVTGLGGIIGFGIMYLLYLFGIIFSKWIIKRRGVVLDEVALGYGDVNLTAILGLLFGWPRIAVLLFFAILMGGLFSAVYLLILKIRKKYELFTPIPYAPFLIISAIILIYISTPQ
jgi:leader peptidase (prepilin peptidase)/N-methyltransferase